MPRIYLQTYGQCRIQSARDVNQMVDVNVPGQSFSIRNGQHRIYIEVQRNNQILIQGPDPVSFSFDIGYENWVLANLLYEPVNPEERGIFGNQQIFINNNWRITTGPTEYVLNNLIHQLRIHENRQSLFSVIISRETEPDRIGVRLRPCNFATIFFAANQLIQVRLNGNYLFDVLERMQRINVQDPNRFALVPFHDPHFLSMFQFMEVNRLSAIEAPPENIQAFNQLFQQALQALYPQRVVGEFIQRIGQVDVEDLLNLQEEPENNYQDILQDFFENN